MSKLVLELKFGIETIFVMENTKIKISNQSIRNGMKVGKSHKNKYFLINPRWRIRVLEKLNLVHTSFWQVIFFSDMKKILIGLELFDAFS